jgi:acyl-CoA thioesterase-1
MIHSDSQSYLTLFKTRLMPGFILSLMLIVLSACSDNKQLQILDSDATILAFGDSLTYGSGASRDKTYPAILQELIKHKVINAGIPGEISATGLRRLPGLLQTYQPDLIIICHGANDILQKLDLSQTQKNIQLMIDLARENQVQVVLIGVPGFNLFLSKAAMYQSLADNNQIPIDNNSLAEILKNNSLKSDYIHPNSNGYKLLAENINQLLLTHGAFLDN